MEPEGQGKAPGARQAWARAGCRGCRPPAARRRPAQTRTAARPSSAPASATRRTPPPPLAAFPTPPGTARRAAPCRRGPVARGRSAPTPTRARPAPAAASGRIRRRLTSPAGRAARAILASAGRRSRPGPAGRPPLSIGYEGKDMGQISDKTGSGERTVAPSPNSAVSAHGERVVGTRSDAPDVTEHRNAFR